MLVGKMHEDQCLSVFLLLPHVEPITFRFHCVQESVLSSGVRFDAVLAILVTEHQATSRFQWMPMTSCQKLASDSCLSVTGVKHYKYKLSWP